MKIDNREYQQIARHRVNRELNNNGNPLLVMPTGTGKTKTTVQIISDRIKLDDIIMVLTPQEEIFDQWMKDLIENDLNPGYINSKGVGGRNRKVYVCMPLSLNNLLNYIGENIYPTVIITDECHHSAADTWENIYNFFPKALRLGLTATPQRTDFKPLGHLYDTIIQTITMQEAIENGFLAKPLLIIPDEYKLDVPVKGKDYDLQAQEKILENPKIIGDIIKEYEHVFGGLPVIVACCTYNHAKEMTEKFIEAGWKWAHIHSKLNKFERRRMLNQVKRGELNGICTVGIGIEGMDIPGLYGLIWLRLTRSLTIYLQFIGRVLRPLPGKDYGIIIDPVGNAVIHGFPEQERNWKLTKEDIKPEETICMMKKCPFCGTMNALENIQCHFCLKDLQGEEFEEAKKRKMRKLPAIVDGELVVIENDGQIESLKNRVKNIKEKQEEAELKKEQEQLLKIDMDDKVKILKRNLLGSDRRKLFKETLENFI